MTPVESSIEVIYLQPEATAGDRCIDFARFTEHVARHEDPFSARFAEALRTWRAPAGLHAPVDLNAHAVAPNRSIGSPGSGS